MPVQAANLKLRQPSPPTTKKIKKGTMEIPFQSLKICESESSAGSELARKNGMQLVDDCWLKVLDYSDSASAKALSMTCRNLYCLSWYTFSTKLSHFFVIPRFTFKSLETSHLISIYEKRNGWCKTCVQEKLSKTESNFVCAGTKPLLQLLDKSLFEE
jgi:hypothetical protein